MKRKRIRLFLALLSAAALYCLPARAVDPSRQDRVDFGERWGADGAPRPDAPVKREPLVPSAQHVGLPEIQRDVAALPEPVRMTRDRLIAAARTGELDALTAVIQSSPVRVMVEPSGTEEPAKVWRSQYPDSEGREVLAILLSLFDAGYVRLGAGTPDEIFVWPYFAHVPLGALDPPRLVELFRLITAYDYQQMRDANTYTFFKIGISADGALHYFMVGE